MAKARDILNRLLEEARLNEEEELKPEESKTENPENATIPDEATEVKPVDAKEDDFIENKNDEDVELTESDDEECKKDEGCDDKKDESDDKKDDDDDKGDDSKDDDDDDKGDDSEDESDADEEDNDDKEALKEAFAMFLEGAKERLAKKSSKLQGKIDTAQNAAKDHSGTSASATELLDKQYAALRVKGLSTEEKRDLVSKIASNSNLAYKSEKDAAKARLKADKLTSKKNIVDAKLNQKTHAAAESQRKKDDKAAKKSGTLREDALFEQLFNMFLEEMGADEDVASATDDFNNEIPEYEDQPVAPEVETDEILDTAGDTEKVDIEEAYDAFRGIIADILAESEDLGTEESKTENPENATIPDEATEVKPVDAKEDDFIENDNETDVELTEEMIEEAFARLRSWYHGKVQAHQEKKAAKNQGQSDDYAAKANKHTNQANMAHARAGQKRFANKSQDLENEATAHRAASKSNSDMANKTGAKAQAARDKAGVAQAKHEAAQKELKEKQAAKAAEKLAKSMVKQDKKAAKEAGRAAVNKKPVNASAEMQALFKMFLEDMGLDEDALENNPEVLAAAETENSNPEDTLQQAEGETALDTETALYDLNDKDINESISNIFKYLREEGLDLGTEESKTENPENATIPDEATEVKPVDAKEDDFIENKNDEDVELTEAKKFKSIREAYSVEPGYFSRDSKQIVTSTEKVKSLTESIAFIEAKNSGDYLFEELLRAVNKVEMLKESIFEKYGEAAASKAERIAKLK